MINQYVCNLDFHCQTHVPVTYLFQIRYPSMTFIKVISCTLSGTCSGRVLSFPQV